VSHTPKSSVSLVFILLLFVGLIAGLMMGHLGSKLPIIDESKVSPLYLAIVGLLVAFSLEALIKSNSSKETQSWQIPALIIYLTTGIWYCIEPIYSPENLDQFSSSILQNAYGQIIIFIVSFRLLIPFLAKRLVAKQVETEVTIAPTFSPSLTLAYLAAIWVVLLGFGIYLLNGDIGAALFPVNSRAGVYLWQRGAAGSAGSGGFLISSAAYTYLLVCALFGVLLPLQTQLPVKLANLGLILISYPYFLLSGARNQFLAVALPAYFSYALLSKQKWWVKVLATGAAFIALNYVLSIVIAYRNVGFGGFLSDVSQGVNANSQQKHLGLNMLEELCFVNSFYQQGLLNLSYGGSYLAEFLNFIPRAIWANKPLIGIDYAILRGFGANDASDIGVFATISPGFMGQGFTNFGPYFGPIATALLLALWGAFLARLWSQRQAILRVCLFLVGLGITFNLGRGVTLLVLWPIIFGYALIRVLEWLRKDKLAPTISSLS